MSFLGVFNHPVDQTPRPDPRTKQNDGLLERQISARPTIDSAYTAPPVVMGGAFQEKLVGQNGSLTGCFAMLRYKNKKLNAEMSTNVTVLHG